MKRNLKRNTLKERINYSTRTKNIVLVLLVLLFFFTISIGFSLLTKQLGLNTNIEVRPNRDIRITNVDGPYTTNGAYENGNYQYSHDLFIAKGVLPNKDSTIQYKLTITNNGSSDKSLDEILPELLGGVEYRLVDFQIGDEVPAGESKVITIEFYNPTESSITYSSEIKFLFNDVYVDITAPTIHFNPESDGKWKNTNQTINISATDDRSIVEFKYCTTTESSCEPTIDADAEGTDVLLTEEGENTLCVIATDNAKNPNSTTECRKYKLDKTAPIITVDGHTSDWTEEIVLGSNGKTDWMTEEELNALGYNITDSGVESKTEYGYQDVASWSSTWSTTVPSGGYYTSKTQYGYQDVASWSSTWSTNKPEYYKSKVQYKVTYQYTTQSTTSIGPCGWVGSGTCGEGKNCDGYGNCECMWNACGSGGCYWKCYKTTSSNQTSTTNWQDTNKPPQGVATKIESRTVYAAPSSWGEVTGWRDSEAYTKTASRKPSTRTVYATPSSWKEGTGWRDSEAYTGTTTRKPVTRTVYRVNRVFEIPKETVTDNLDPNPTVTTSGNVNTNVPGTYTITYTAVDHAKNQKTLKYTVKVVLPTIQSWSSDASTDFHDSNYKSNIISAKFVTTNEVPTNAVASWDVSEAKNGSVMAWVLNDTSNSGKYNLYIGGNGIIYANSNSSYLFYQFEALTTVTGLENFDTSNVTNMRSMFSSTGEYATSFELKGLENWDTSNVTDMSNMFWGAGYSATSWTIGDLSNWNTSNVTNMSYMFASAGRNATSWTIGDLSNWDTSKVTNMGYMFHYAGYSATSFELKGLENWNTSNVTDMSNMFYCAGYQASTWSIGDLSSWNTSQVTNMKSMFGYAGYSVTSSLLLGDLSTKTVSKDGTTYIAWDTSNVTNMSYMFDNFGRNATTWNIGNIGTWDIGKVKDVSYMFSTAGYNATTWDIGDLSNWNTSQVTNMKSIFNYAGNKASTFDIGDLSSWDTSNVTSMYSMFYSAGYSATTWNIGDLSKWNTSKVTDMGSMFYYAGYSASTWDIGNLDNWDTSQVTNMSFMFFKPGYSASTWNIGDLSKWNTGKVTNMKSMFGYAGYSVTSSLLLGDLSTKTVSKDGTTYIAWDTSNVTNMSYMFDNFGRNAATWNIGNIGTWDIGKVKDVSYMFSTAGYNATTWDIGDLSNWNTSQVTNMKSMFYFAGYSATTWNVGDLSKWNTSNVTNMHNMFYAAGYKTANYSLNLSSWDVSKVTDYTGFNSYATSKITPPKFGS